MATWKEKYNKKYGFEKDKAHSLSDISKKTGVSKKGIQQIYNKGIGAYKTNPQSVRPNVTSKEQWAMARVYSAVSGGKASKVDAKELKMEKGGQIENFDRVGFYKDYYQRLSPSEFIVDRDNSSIIIDMNKGGKLNDEFSKKIEILKKEGYPQKQAVAIAYSMKEQGKFESGGKTEYDYGSYTTFDEEKIRNETEGVQYILNGEYILVARSLYMQDKELFNYYKYLQRLNITLEDCNKFALSLNNVFTDMVCNIKVIQKTDGNRSYASYKVRDYNNLESNSSYWGVENIDGVKKMINTSTDMVCCKGTFLERLSRKPIPAVDLKNYYSFQTLIHELAHCLDFQFQFKQGKLPVVAHKEYFLNALYKIIEACKNGTLPLAKNFGVRARGLKKASQLLNGKI